MLDLDFYMASPSKIPYSFAYLWRIGPLEYVPDTWDTRVEMKCISMFNHTVFGERLQWPRSFGPCQGYKQTSDQASSASQTICTAIKWHKVMKAPWMKSVDGAKRNGMIQSTCTGLGRFHGAKPWKVLERWTGRWYPRQREAVCSKTCRHAVRCVPGPAINGKITLVSAVRDERKDVSRPDHACAPEGCGAPSLCAVGHGESREC